MEKENVTPKKHEVRKVRELLPYIMDTCVGNAWKVPSVDTKIDMIADLTDLTKDEVMSILLNKKGDTAVNINSILAVWLFVNTCNSNGFFDVKEYEELVWCQIETFNEL